MLNKTNLNTNFITNIGADWAAKIAETTWYVGGMTSTNGERSNAKTAYNFEVGANKDATTYNAKIGLMYVSDYGFAAAPSAWTANLNTYNGEAIKNVNWMYMGLYEWTISRRANFSDDAFYVNNGGYVGYFGAYNSNIGVRPSFNLLSSVTYVEGDGTKNLPIRIN